MIINATALALTIGGRRILQDVHLSRGEGEICGLLGLMAGIVTAFGSLLAVGIAVASCISSPFPICVR